MSAPIDIYNKAAMLELDKALENAPPNIIMLYMTRFPFHMLPNIAAVDYESIIPVISIFHKYLQVKNIPLKDIEQIFQFYRSLFDAHLHIRTVRKPFLGFPTIEVLEMILNGFELSLRLAIDSGAINTNEAFDLIYAIQSYGDGERILVEVSKKLFLHLLPIPNISDSSNFDTCASWLWQNMRENGEMLQFAFAFCCDHMINNLSFMDDIYEFIIQFIETKKPCFNDSIVLEQLMACIIYVYDKCVNESSLAKLSLYLANANFPYCFREYFQPHDKRHQLEIILYGEICYLEDLKKTPWNCDSQTLQEAVSEYAESCFTKMDLTDFKIIMLYLALTYKYKPRREDVLLQLTMKFHSTAPSNPIVLKATLLLFAVYWNNQLTTKEMMLQNNLLLSLQLPRQSQLITYHVAQLLWILRSGSSALKMNAVMLWLENCELKMIRRCIKVTGSQQILVDVICTSESHTIVKHALEILHSYGGNAMDRYLISVLLRPHCTTRTVCLLATNCPDFAVTQRTDQRMIRMTRRIIESFVLLLSNPKERLENTVRWNLLNFIYRRTQYFQTQIVVISTCLVPRFANTLMKAMQSDSRYIVTMAFKLLHWLIVVQKRLHLSASESTNFVPRLSENDASIIYATRICTLLLNHTDEKPILFIKLGDYFSVYRGLMNFIVTKNGYNVVRVLTMLMQRSQECLFSPFNMLAIRMNTRERTLDTNYINYLINWHSLASEHSFIVPEREIENYVKMLDEVEFNDIDYSCLTRE